MQSRDTAPLPSTPTEGRVSGPGRPRGPASPSPCARALRPAGRPCARRAHPRRPPLRARRFLALPAASAGPQPSPALPPPGVRFRAPERRAKMVRCNSWTGRQQLASLPPPKSALLRPSRTPERHRHLPTTFYAQAVRSPPANANSRAARREPLPPGAARAPLPHRPVWPELAGPGEPRGPRARIPRMVWPLSRSA